VPDYPAYATTTNHSTAFLLRAGFHGPAFHMADNDLH
jgi:hypothetical protein